MTRIIALTGGSGFVGRRLIPRLTETGVTVRLLARDPARLGEQANGARIVLGDLADRKALDTLVSGADAVIHMAGAIAAPDRATFDRVNVKGTASIAAIAARHGVARFVHLSSMAARQPDLSDYAASKLSGETALMEHAADMSWVILRPPAVYGPGDKATLPLIAQLIRRHALVPGTALNRTSLIHVDDLADALILLAANDNPHGSVHEIDDGKPGGYSWADLGQIAGRAEGISVSVHHLPKPVMVALAHCASAFARVAGKPALVTPGKVRELYHPDWVARHDLLTGICGWRPRVDFTEGVASTLEWYRDHQWLPAGTSAARTQNQTDKSETTV
ncbi:MAG: NAD-dependent epimerase/dehydratase family protein [Rhizobiales bacterium]|nr:NAD-dependent epimerase/dehydratase family protein [Hyphomicrobiales bacterium]